MKAPTTKTSGLSAAPGSADGPTPRRYRWTWQGITFDFYRLCEILGISHHAHAHALKKVIRAGRSVKPIAQDIDEAIAALLRWKQMISEDGGGKTEPDTLPRLLDALRTAKPWIKGFENMLAGSLSSDSRSHDGDRQPRREINALLDALEAYEKQNDQTERQ